MCNAPSNSTRKTKVWAWFCARHDYNSHQFVDDAAMTEPVRLSKRLIELIGCSRREADLYIAGGWVLVDGEVVEEPQFKVLQQSVELHPDAVLAEQETVTLLLHLPAEQTAEDALIALSIENHWPDDSAGIRILKSHFKRLTAALPLQPGASGLHILTQDWRILRKLTDDGGRLEQEYIVEVTGELAADGLKRLNASVRYLGQELPPCKVSWQNETRLRFAVKNPAPGQIRYLCESAGLSVLTMKRIRVGAAPMSKLQPGQWRYLPAKERF